MDNCAVSTRTIFRDASVLDPERGELSTGRTVVVEDGIVREVAERPTTATAALRQHRAQELRHHLKMTVGLERGVPARTDMVQHEDGADAGKDRTQQIMRAGEVKRSQSGADDVAAKLLHRGWLAGWDVIPKLAGDH